MIKRNRYSNPRVDSLIERIQSMPFGKERDNLIVKTNSLLYEEVPWIYLWHGQAHTVTQPEISGYQPKTIFNAERYTEIFRQ
jgi:ABC-type transport system substrate-binding protein